MRYGFLTAAALALTACGTTGASIPSASPSTVTTVTTLPTVTSTTSPAPSLQLVAIGDSYMSAHDSKGRSFVDVYVASLRDAGYNVGTTFLTDNQNDTFRVLANLETPSVASAVGDADIVVLSVGGNDVDPFGVFPAGTCSPSQPQADCLQAYAPKFAENFDAILSKIEELRAGKPTAIRVLGADNPFVGWKEAPTPSFGVDFFAQVAAAETAAVCDAAVKHHGVCIDFFHVFSGPKGTDDPVTFLASDHGHPGDLGIATIGAMLTKTRLAELG